MQPRQHAQQNSQKRVKTPTKSQISAVMRAMGGRGGRSGTGSAKRRPREHYQAAALISPNPTAQ
jgi:hypothetical protein